MRAPGRNRYRRTVPCLCASCRVADGRRGGAVSLTARRTPNASNARWRFLVRPLLRRWLSQGDLESFETRELGNIELGLSRTQTPAALSSAEIQNLSSPPTSLLAGAMSYQR